VAASKPWPLFPLLCRHAVMFWCRCQRDKTGTRPPSRRRQYGSTSRRRHQLVMLSHTLYQRVWILKLISHSASYPGGYTHTFRCSGCRGERRIKQQASSVSAGSEQTGRMCLSCWHWLPNSSASHAKRFTWCKLQTNTWNTEAQNSAVGGQFVRELCLLISAQCGSPIAMLVS